MWQPVVSEFTPAVEEWPGVRNYGSQVQRDDKMPVFSRIVSVEVAIHEESRTHISIGQRMRSCSYHPEWLKVADALIKAHSLIPQGDQA